MTRNILGINMYQSKARRVVTPGIVRPYTRILHYWKWYGTSETPAWEYTII